MAGTVNLAAVLLMVLAVAAPAAADGVPPEAAHAIDVKCASVALAAVSASRPPASDADTSEDTRLIGVTRKRAQASGAALGLTQDQTDRAIDEGAAKIARNLSKTADAEAMKREQLDLGRVLLECAVLQTQTGG